MLDSKVFTSLEALLELFDDFGGSPGTMFVIAEPTDPGAALTPVSVDGEPDLFDPATSSSVAQYIADSYLMDPLFRCRASSAPHKCLNFPQGHGRNLLGFASC